MYTSQSDIEALGLIPSRLPWDEQTTADKIAVWITQSGREIDAGVGPDFPVLSSGWKFSPHPDTPDIVALTCAWLVASYLFQALGVVSRDDGPPAWVRYREMAERKIADIRMGRIDIFGEDGEATDTDSPTPITVEARPAVTVSGWSMEKY